ncbi:MAG TPA: hypothetical protein VGK21_03085 [Candidatus Angelobacter sp.]
MKSAAIGVSVHSGWGAVVAIAGNWGIEEVLLRRRVVIIDSKIAGSAQPYHYVAKKEISAAEKHLTRCASVSGNLAFEALTQVSTELGALGFAPKVAVVLLSSARPLPDLNAILASHALIHTAEGEFFRQAFRSAFEKLRIPVTGIRTRDLDDCAVQAFGKAASAIQKRIYGMGRSLGAPWTKDEKTAALAAAIVLNRPAPKVRAVHGTGA